MEPGVMLSADREYSVKGRRIFMQNLPPEGANALSSKDLRHPSRLPGICRSACQSANEKQRDTVVPFSGGGAGEKLSCEW